MRKEKKALLLAALIIIFIMSLAMVGTAAEKAADSGTVVKAEPLKNLFNDVSSTDNNALFINYLADLKIINGFPDGSFKSKEGLTRAQVAVILAKAAGIETPVVSSKPFADVEANHWAAPSIAAAAKAGYIKGYPDGNYHPEEKLTRAQGIALMMRLSKQQARDELPTLKDMPKNHWAADDMATALNAGMIGLSEDKTQAYPEAEMTRGSLARALGTLLTKDPGLYTKTLAGTIKEIKGEIKLTRAGSTTILQNDAPIYKGDSISAGANSTAYLTYPDGSSVLIKESTELQIKESIGRVYIKQDGSSGIAVDNVVIDMKKGTLFGALATQQENTPQERQSARAGETLVASLDGLEYIADSPNSKTPPWYQQAEAKKVKMKVDMPYGVAAIRGTFFLVSFNLNEKGEIVSCNVSCLTGDAAVSGKSGAEKNVSDGTTVTVNKEGSTSDPGPLSEEEKAKLADAAVQKWALETAQNMDNNQEAKVETVVEIPDQTVSPTQQIQNTIDVVLKALESSGIKLNEAVKKELEGKLKEEIKNNPPPPASQITNQPGGSGGGASEESSVNYINYAAPDKTYGPESAADTQTISKNIIISAPGVTLRNMIITKDLTLGAGIGDGSVTLKNVKVQGNTTILGGGSESITIENCELYTITVNKQTNTVRIVATGSTIIGDLTLNSGAKLEESELTGAGFSSVSTGLSLPAGAKIILSGNFAEVNINAPDLNIEVKGGSSITQMGIGSNAGGAKLNLALGASVAALEVSAQANIDGDGTITAATIKANNVVMTQTPTTLNVASGINASVGGQQVSEGSTQIVSTIVISGDNSITILPSGMVTRNYTATAKDQSGKSMTGESVTWSIKDSPSGVSIDSGGVLTVPSGTPAGTCTIVATSASNPSKTKELQVALILSVVTSIIISGDESINIPAEGTSRTYTATVKDQGGNSITGESVSWSLLNAADRVTIGETSGIMTVESGSNANSCTVVATSTSKPGVTGQLEISLSSGSIGQMSINVADQIISGTTTGSAVTGGGVYIKNNTLNKWVKPRGDFSTGQIFGCRYIDSRNESCFIGPFTGSNAYAEWSINLSGLNLLPSCEYSVYLYVDDANGVHQDQDIETFSLDPDSNISTEESSIIYAESYENGMSEINVEIKDGSGNVIENLTPQDFSIWLDGTANPICLTQAPLCGFDIDGYYIIYIFGTHTINQFKVKGVSIVMPDDPQNPGQKLQSLVLSPTGGETVSGTVKCNDVGLGGVRVEAYRTNQANDYYYINSVESDEAGNYSLIVPSDGDITHVRCIKEGYAQSDILEDNFVMVSDLTPPNSIQVDNPNFIEKRDIITLTEVNGLSNESWMDIYEWIKSHTSSAADPWITGIQPSELDCYINPINMELCNNSETEDAQIVKDFMIPNYLVVDKAGNMAQGNIVIDSLCYWKDEGIGLGAAGTGSISLASSSVAYVDSEHQPHIKIPLDPGEWNEKTDNWPGSLPPCKDIDLVEGGTGNSYKMFCAYRDTGDNLSFMQYAYEIGDMSTWRWTSLGSPAPGENVGLFKSAAILLEGYFPAVAYQHTVGEAVYGSIRIGAIDGNQFQWMPFTDFYSDAASLQALDMKIFIDSNNYPDLYVAYVDSNNNLYVKRKQGSDLQILGDPFSLLTTGFKANCGLSMAFYNGDPVIAYADGDGGIHVRLWDGEAWEDILSPAGLTAGNSPVQLACLLPGQEQPPLLMLVYTSETENRISVRFYDGQSWQGDKDPEGKVDPRFNEISEPVAEGADTLAVEKGQVIGLPAILFKGQDGDLHLIKPIFAPDVHETY